MEGHCKYAFLASPEGLSYSGRLKYLQNCQSVVFTRTAVSLQHWTHLYNSNRSDPLQNMVVLPPVKGDIDLSWTNIAPEMDYLLADDDRAKQIASRSAEIFRDRFLSPAAVACYWRVSGVKEDRMSSGTLIRYLFPLPLLESNQYLCIHAAIQGHPHWQ
jgi:hypothetical protein